MRFKTYSGSEYEIQGSKVRRLNSFEQKRGDGEWVTLIHSEVFLGLPALLVMESLSAYGPDDFGRVNSDSPTTTRMTSDVISIEEDEDVDSAE